MSQPEGDGSSEPNEATARLGQPPPGASTEREIAPNFKCSLAIGVSGRAGGAALIRQSAWRSDPSKLQPTPAINAIYGEFGAMSLGPSEASTGTAKRRRGQEGVFQKWCALTRPALPPSALLLLLSRRSACCSNSLVYYVSNVVVACAGCRVPVGGIPSRSRLLSSSCRVLVLGQQAAPLDYPLALGSLHLVADLLSGSIASLAMARSRRPSASVVFLLIFLTLAFQLPPPPHAHAATKQQHEEGQRAHATDAHGRGGAEPARRHPLRQRHEHPVLLALSLTLSSDTKINQALVLVYGLDYIRKLEAALKAQTEECDKFRAFFSEKGAPLPPTVSVHRLQFDVSAPAVDMGESGSDEDSDVRRPFLLSHAKHHSLS